MRLLVIRIQIIYLFLGAIFIGLAVRTLGSAISALHMSILSVTGTNGKHLHCWFMLVAALFIYVE